MDYNQINALVRPIMQCITDLNALTGKYTSAIFSVMVDWFTSMFMIYQQIP